jgi:hypothetical protein
MKPPAGVAGAEIATKIGVLGLIFFVFELIIEPFTFFDEKRLISYLESYIVSVLNYCSVARGSVVIGVGSITAWPTQASGRAKSGRHKTVSVTACLGFIIYDL